MGVQSAKAEYDFHCVERDGEFDLYFQTQSALGIAFGTLGAGGAGAFGFLFTLVGLFLLKETLIVFLIGLGLIYVAYLIYKKTHKKNSNKITINKNEIISGGRAYAISDIMSLGSSSPAGGVAQVGGDAASLGAFAGSVGASGAGHYIFIIYGSQRITILSGLSPDTVRQAYDLICVTLEKLGHRYGNDPSNDGVFRPSN